jgi:hypothetical protein
MLTKLQKRSCWLEFAGVEERRDKLLLSICLVKEMNHAVTADATVRRIGGNIRRDSGWGMSMWGTSHKLPRTQTQDSRTESSNNNQCSSRSGSESDAGNYRCEASLMPAPLTQLIREMGSSSTTTDWDWLSKGISRKASAHSFQTTRVLAPYVPSHAATAAAASSHRRLQSQQTAG